MGFTSFDIDTALAVLRAEGTLLYPSDTLWGIGCDARSDRGVNAIYALKKRPDAKALICLVSDREMLETHVGAIDPLLQPYLVDERPTTVIYPSVNGLSKHLGAADGSVGIRLVTDPFCQALIQGLGAPIVSTSANLAGDPSPTAFASIQDEILAGVDHVVPLKQNEKQTQASRIVRVAFNRTIEILRP